MEDLGPSLKYLKINMKTYKNIMNTYITLETVFHRHTLHQPISCAQRAIVKFYEE